MITDIERLKAIDPALVVECADPDCRDGNYIYDDDDEDTGRHGWNPCNQCEGAGAFPNIPALIAMAERGAVFQKAVHDHTHAANHTFVKEADTAFAAALHPKEKP